MKKIGFKNFRRFEKFDPIDLGEITFLVGKNNSGKSTLVKAILLVIDYLQNEQVGRFKFDGKFLNDANVVSFKRTLYNQAKTDLISFDFRFGEFDCYIEITGSEYDTVAEVARLKLKQLEQGFKLDFNFIGTPEVTISREYSQKMHEDESLILLNSRIEVLKSTLENYKGAKSDVEYIRTLDEIRSFEKKKITAENVNLSDSKDYELSYQLTKQGDKALSIPQLIGEVAKLNRIEKNEGLKGSNNDAHAIRSLFNDASTLNNLIEHQFGYLLRVLNVSYFGADSFKQSALFSLKDKDNSLAIAIHDFYQLKIQRSDEAHKFLRDWMNEFDIGKSVKILPIEGEVYKCIITNKDGTKINLADTGMGSLQVMKLLFRIASVIHKHEFSYGFLSNELLIIEEPELNLHPKLQSLLTELLYKVNKKYGFQFIVETHSEYIIKNTQVIGRVNRLFLDKESKTNPFKIYFFHTSTGPYAMEYDTNGKFVNEFESGFSDVSRKLSRKLL